MICGVPNFGEAPGESASHYELSRIRLIVTSRQVAEHFGKQHKNVLQSIRNLECSEEFNRLNFQPVEYVDAKGETRTEYAMTRDGFTFLAMGFTGKEAARWKEKYIEAFNAMEQRLRVNSMPAPMAERAFRRREQAQLRPDV